jgi:hypothetical protein
LYGFCLEVEEIIFSSRESEELEGDEIDPYFNLCFSALLFLCFSSLLFLCFFSSLLFSSLLNFNFERLFLYGFSISISSAFSCMGFVWKSRKSYFPAGNRKNSKEMKSIHILISVSPLFCFSSLLFLCFSVSSLLFSILISSAFSYMGFQFQFRAPFLVWVLFGSRGNHIFQQGIGRTRRR